MVDLEKNVWLHSNVLRISNGVAVVHGSERIEIGVLAPWYSLLSDLLDRDLEVGAFPEPVWFGPVLVLIRQRDDLAVSYSRERKERDRELHERASIRRDTAAWLAERMDGDGILSADLAGVQQLVDTVGCDMPSRKVKVRVQLVAEQVVEFEYDAPFGTRLDDLDNDEVIDAAQSESSMYMWEVIACAVL